MQYDTIVVGAGASGLFASIILAKRGKRVLLLEHNNIVGKKLLITGKGRCNLTNNSSNEEILQNIPTNSRFMFSALTNFSSKDTMSFFEDLGVKLKTERGNRVFPVSDKASEIAISLENAVKKNKVTLINNEVTELIIEDNSIKGVLCGNIKYSGDNVIIATGGMSYIGTGSTGDGYKLAKQAGHRVTKLNPSLVPIVTEEKFCAEMMGLSLKNVTLTLKDKNEKKPIYSELGEMLFTHFGVSGPLVLSASSHIRQMQEDRYSLEIDLKPGLSEQQLDNRIQRDFSEYPNKDFSNILIKLLPSKLIPVIISLSDISPDTKVNQITKQQRTSFVKLVKCFPLKVKSFRPLNEAIITSGGVDTKEISPKTMESKLINGLYFIGEVLDVDAYTGGFNLQIAFSTAYAAATNI